MCGNKNPFSLTTPEESVWIWFKYGDSVSFAERGFVAGYVLYDSSDSSKSSGFNLSMKYVSVSTTWT